MKRLEIGDVDVYYIGPDLSKGPLPTLFYFALSAEDSLGLDPFNQPVKCLAGLPMRVFSMTLPGHEDKLPPTEALYRWAEEIAAGRPLVSSFVSQVKEVVSHLLEKGVIREDALGISGLSRGGFLATHVAAEIPLFRYLLAFAPLTQPAFAKELQTIAHLPSVQSLSLHHLVDRLTHCHVRFYIGNLDTRVNTRFCFDFIQALAQKDYEEQIRSPQVELFITPSIGRDGHGTAPEIFRAGAEWIAHKLKVTDGM